MSITSSSRIPTHGITNCESCHVAGAYNVPDQSKSLPGLLSASAEINGWDRKIGEVPVLCHRSRFESLWWMPPAELINEDSFGGLIVLNQHMKQGGYLIEAGEDPNSTLASVIDQIMGFFK